MAAVIAVRLRDLARERVMAAGGRGFVRFCPEGPQLLATDAYGRCEGKTAQAALVQAVESAGFSCCVQGNLLLMTPQEALIKSVCPEAKAVQIDWDDPLHPVLALCARWSRAPVSPLTCAGRQLVVDTLRLTWQGKARVNAGLDALRAQAAVMQRTGDRSGLRMAAAILEDVCTNG